MMTTTIRRRRQSECGTHAIHLHLLSGSHRSDGPDRSPLPDRFTPFPDVNVQRADQLVADLELLKLEQLAELKCRDQPGSGKRKQTYDQIATFQKDPITQPLLHSVQKADVKKAIEAFKLILSYSQIRKMTAEPLQTALALLNIALSDPSLNDEVYFQLMKQTSGNSDKNQLRLTWELFLFVSSLVLPSKWFEIWIKAHFLRNTEVKNRPIARVMQLAEFRFTLRIAIGTSESKIDIPLLKSILDDVADSHRCYKISLYEQMWHQRRTHPHLLIPVVIYRIANALLERGAEKWEGIFRLVGNMAHVNAMWDKLNAGEDPLADVPINDLASLFKSWFGSLPYPLVPASELPRLKAVGLGDRNFVGFVESLPPLHGSVLTYLIGFLKRMAASAEITKMSALNLAMCFGPTVISSEGVGAMDFAAHTDLSSEFLVDLIQNLPTERMFPHPTRE